MRFTGMIALVLMAALAACAHDGEAPTVNPEVKATNRARGDGYSSCPYACGRTTADQPHRLLKSG